MIDIACKSLTELLSRLVKVHQILDSARPFEFLFNVSCSKIEK